MKWLLFPITLQYIARHVVIIYHKTRRSSQYSFKIFGEKLVRSNTSKVSGWAKPTEVRLRKRATLSIDCLSIRVLEFYVYWKRLIGGCLRSGLLMIIDSFIVSFFPWVSEWGKHGEVLDVWCSSIENTSNCQKCIFQASGQSKLCGIRVRCFG